MEEGSTAGARHFPGLAVIGCGAVVAERHLPALARIGWRPCVLIDRNRERAVKLARRCKARRVVEDVSELAAGEVQAALVATNMASHAELSLPLLERGIHLFVEKPLATSAAQAQAMVEAAAKTGACLAVGHKRRFLFVNRWLKALVESGALGAIERFDAREGTSYHNQSSGPLRAARIAERIGPNSPAFWSLEMSGGGVLLETGAHTLDTLLWQLGPAQLRSYRDDALGGVESDALIELELAGGAKGTVELSRARTLRNSAIIAGSRGQIEVSLHRNAVLRAQPDDLIGFEFNGQSGAAMPEEDLVAEMFERELADWLCAIRAGGEPFVSGASAMPVVALAERCYRKRRPLRQPWHDPAQPQGDGAVSSTVSMRISSRWRSPAQPRGDGALNGRADLGSRRLALATAQPRGDGALNGRRVLVTGATGFIGARLVEKLVLEEGAHVRAAVRNFEKAARLARFASERVELRHFDMADPKASGSAVNALVEGCDTLFHLARDTQSLAANEQAARRIGAACLRAGVRRLVHVSSLSVYEPLPNAPLTEQSPTGQRPGNDKLAAEREIMRMARQQGLPATVIQPCIVYGPFSRHWTERPADMLANGILVLPAPGDGICNAVHVDDLVRALVLAAWRDEAVGGTFLVSGPEHPTWLDFYRAYEKALGRSAAIRLAPYEEIRRQRRGAGGLTALLAPRRLLDQRPLRPLRQALRAAIYPRLGERGKAWAKQFYEQGRLLPARRSDRPPEFLPQGHLLDLYVAKCPVRIDKARRLLGYEPEIGLASGMEHTARYLDWARG